MSKEKKVRLIIAILLIVIGASGLLWLELGGREMLNCENVYIASKNISQGDEITLKLVEQKSFLKDTVIEDAITEKNIEKYVGKVAKQKIVKGSQLHPDYIADKEKYVEKGESIFKLPMDWISSCSSSIRKGDKIAIYDTDSKKIGEFKVAFVKDAQEREVVSTGKEAEALERTDGTAPIDSIEIITTYKKFKEIKDIAIEYSEEKGEILSGIKFTIVQLIN